MIIKCELFNCAAWTYYEQKRNLAAKNTYTEYLAFFDSDSFASSDWIEHAIKKINQDENICAWVAQIHHHLIKIKVKKVWDY